MSWFSEEFSQMKEEVPPPLVDAHLRTVQEAVKEGIPVDANYGLDKTGIAGTGPDRKDPSTVTFVILCLKLPLPCTE